MPFEGIGVPALLWFVLIVQPGRERIAQQILVEGGFNIFCPVGHRMRRSRRGARKVVVAGPQMPGYLFIGFAGAPPWLEVFRYAVVTGVIGHDGYPTAIPDQEMRHVFTLEQRPIPYINHPHGKRAYRLKGSTEIISGPYQGRRVKVVEAPDGAVARMFELFNARKEVA